MSKPKGECAICAKWPPAMRAAMRAAITVIPPHQWVCDDCLGAFFTIIAKHSRTGEPPNVEENPDAVAVEFFASYAAKHPRSFPAKGPDVQGVFFDAWLQEHPDAKLETVPADMVMASGSGLDPHITLRNARYQLDRVVAARAPTDADRPRVRQQIEVHLQQAAFKPLTGLAGGDSLVNILEINLQLDRDLPMRPAK